MRKIVGTSVVKKMDFNGDILITDPCYVKGDSFKGRAISNNTLYGDWSCTVWKANNYDECIEDNKIGEFCADSGMVMVADWNDIKKHDPEAEQFVADHYWCATIIKDFNGTVQMIKIDREFEYGPEMEEYGYTPGEKYIDSSLELVGKGNINWIAAQTGF